MLQTDRYLDAKALVRLISRTALDEEQTIRIVMSYIRRVEEMEREACARVVESTVLEEGDWYGSYLMISPDAERLAAAIRGRE